MAYQNYNHNNNVNSHKPNNRFKANQPCFETISVPLHLYYKDKAALFLENGKAYQAAKEFQRIPTHQLRKVLNLTKQASAEIQVSELNFEHATNILYSLVPLAAYNAGRDKELKKVYSFLLSHINKNTITSIKDIEVFDELITSIIAYHKFMSK